MDDARDRPAGAARAARFRISALLLLTIALSWPAIVTGGALWFDDIGPYVRGGFVGIDTLTGVFRDVPIENVPTVTGPEAAGGLVAAAAVTVSGARSVAYSAFAYLAFVLERHGAVIVLIQVAVAGFLISSVAPSRRALLEVTILAGLLSTLPFVVSTASPDVWAGYLILAWCVFEVGGIGRSVVAIVVVGAIAAFGVAAHASHVPLAGALLIGSVLLHLLGRGTGRLGPLLVAGGFVAAGVIGTVALGVVGFGETSVAPKRYPIVLARAIEDGPALWHLEEHCDTENYAVCEVFPEEIPDDVGTFLWGDEGVRVLATPEQMDRIRAEEALIVRRAMQEYPLAQARRVAGNVASQLVMLDSQDNKIGLRPYYEGDGSVRQEGNAWRGPWRGAFDWLQNAFFWLSAIAGLALFASGRVTLRSVGGRALFLVAIGLVANAAICGALSVPVHRYQARVSWVLPVVLWLTCRPELAAAAKSVGAQARSLKSSSVSSSSS